jgi:hypothetical protein
MDNLSQDRSDSTTTHAAVMVKINGVRAKTAPLASAKQVARHRRLLDSSVSRSCPISPSSHRPGLLLLKVPLHPQRIKKEGQGISISRQLG